ncbi:cancer/testis antigen 55-like [Peromyscus maniculatus bairdii]|uniref:cancer/testis antigen 55-like n=1 Tax=Peromyscus maniculatus bairdii TaxID=230844 RepID=UPI003FCF4331
MQRILRRILNFFWRSTESEENLQIQDNPLGDSPHDQDISKLKTVRGIVTTLCTDCGCINESIFFNPDMVCGNVPVNVGMNVIALVEEDETTHALKTIKVKAVSDPIYGIEPSEFDKRLCIKCVTYTTGDNIYISEETFFPMQLLSGGFLPFKGDLLLVEYSLKPGTPNITINAVSFLNSQNMDEVCVTSIDGRTGIVDDIIFFTEDSLQKPTDYTPGLYDIVNVVAVDSIQPHCSWRAVSMIPVETY